MTVTPLADFRLYNLPVFVLADVLPAGDPWLYGDRASLPRFEGRGEFVDELADAPTPEQYEFLAARRCGKTRTVFRAVTGIDLADDGFDCSGVLVPVRTADGVAFVCVSVNRLGGKLRTLSKQMQALGTQGVRAADALDALAPSLRELRRKLRRMQRKRRRAEARFFQRIEGQRASGFDWLGDMTPFDRPYAQALGVSVSALSDNDKRRAVEAAIAREVDPHGRQIAIGSDGLPVVVVPSYATEGGE